MMTTTDEPLAGSGKPLASSEPLLHTLTHWQKPHNNVTPLTTLRLYRQARLAYPHDETAALQHLVQQALDHLAHDHPTYAKVLQSRFLGQEKVSVMLTRLRLSESHFYRLVKEGTPLLGTALLQLEASAQQHYATQMRQRLELTTDQPLIGQQAEVRKLATLLQTVADPWLVAITGIGGIGKSTLADAVMRDQIASPHWQAIGWVTARQTFLNAGGAITSQPNPLLTTHRLIETLAAQLLGETSSSNPRPIAETLTQLERLLKAAPYLLVIDNLESVVDLGYLLPMLRRLANPSKFLLTTRVSLFDEADLYHWDAPELSATDALALVHQEAALRNIPAVSRASDDDLLPIYDTVGGNPLALKLVTSQLRIHPLAIVLADLVGARTQSAAALYTYIYRRAWDLLDEAAQDLLLAMPLVSEQGGRFDLLQIMVELPPALLRSALETLVAMNLVEVRGDLHKRRYTIHSLTRTFLHEQVLQWQA